MRRAVLIVVAALGLTLVPAVASTPPSAQAAPSDVVAIVIEGTGFGHGRGMSQWGAYGWAVDESKSWQWILDHYYGGTTLGDVDTAQARIRVRLLGLDGAGTVGVTAGSGSVSAGGFTSRSLYAQETSANRFEIYGSSSMVCPGGSTLTVPNGPIARNSGNSTAVRQIQTFLNAYRITGDATLAVDGDFGPLTESRLRDWQRDQNLADDGVWHTPEATRARQLIGAGSGGTWSLLGTVTGPVTFTSPNGENSSASPSSVLGVCDAGGRVTHYRGKIEVRSESFGNRVVNDVKTEDYLRGVVPKEISASWANAGGGKGVNAVRAQAVAARSYGLQQRRYSYASICDSQSCQVYFGSASRGSASSPAVAVEDPRTDAAIAATAGKVRKFPSGAIASTEFSASNGPRTAGGVFPAVDDVPGDGTDRNPNHRWTRVLDADVLAARHGLGSITSASMVEAASSTYRQFDGIWFNDIVLTGSNGNSFRQQAWDFRGRNGLPSPGFTVRVVTEDTTSTSFAFIGDSVGSSIAASSSSEFRVLTDGTFPSARYDSVPSRCTVSLSCPGTSGVQAAASVPRGTQLVVVQLGYNDWPPSFPGYIDQMMVALRARDVAHVAWVNLAEIRGSGGSYYRESNTALRNAASRYGDLTVLDWNAASDTAERDRWFSDDVHLTSTGQAEFASWLRAEVLELAPGISGRLGPPRRLEIPVVGETVVFADGTTGVVPPTASAVAANATAVDPSGPGFFSVWPCGVDRPVASSLNYGSGDIVSNGLIAPIGADGTVCLYSHQGSDVVFDVTGWFDGAAATGGGGLTSITPARVADSRFGTGMERRRLQPGNPVRLQIEGLPVRQPDGTSLVVPASATAAAINVVAVEPADDGFITVYPCGPRPLASTLNYEAGEIRANGALTPLDADGGLCVASHKTTDVVLDLTGWFTPAADVASTTFVAATPDRWVDTRIGLGAPRRPVSRDAPLRIEVVGRTVTVDGRPEMIPPDAQAAVINAIAVEPGRNGFTTVYPCGPRPLASSINYAAGSITANNAIVPLGADGSICLHAHNDTHVVVDATGWINDTGGFVGLVPDRLVDTRDGTGPRPV